MSTNLDNFWMNRARGMSVALVAALLVVAAACNLQVPQPNPDPDPDPDPDPTPSVELPARIVEDDVALALETRVYVQNLTVEGNNCKLVGDGGPDCGDDDEGRTVIEGDVVIIGNDCEFENISFRGTIEVRGKNVQFVNSCLNGETAEVEQPVFGGDAAIVTGNILGLPADFVSTGELPADGGALEDSLLDADIPGALHIEVLHASVVGVDKKTEANASLCNTEITIGNNNITVGFIRAHARAKCVDGAPEVSGGFEVDDLVVNGVPIDVTADVNQVFTISDENDVDVGQIVVNEQINTVDGLFGAFEVNALRIEVFNQADISLGHARASIECPEPQKIVTPPPTGGDFFTGGGFIETGDVFANFGVAGGLRENGELFGHLNYIDHGTETRIRATAVTTYTEVNENTRRLEGECEVNEIGGNTFVVEVVDNGEPGIDDTFSISVSNGYEASGNLVGGNIQLHEEVVASDDDTDD